MSRDPKQDRGQVRRLARHYHTAWLGIAGASLSLEDVEQEIWLVWHRVNNCYDPARGAQFQTLLATAVRNQMMALSRRYRRRLEVATVSLDDASVSGDDQSDPLVETIRSDMPSAEEQIIAREEARALRERIAQVLDPRLVKAMELTEHTPPEIERQLESARAKAEHAHTLGLQFRAPREVTMQMVSTMLGVSRSQRHRGLAKLKELMNDD